MASGVVQKLYATIISLPFFSSATFQFFKNLCHYVQVHTSKIQIFLIKGVEKNNNHPITTLFIGTEESAYQFAYLICRQIDRMSLLGRFLPAQINPSHLPNAEIIMANVRKPLANKFLKHDFLFLPTVSFCLDLRKSINDMIKEFSRRRRRDIKKLKSLNYFCTICRGAEKDFDSFYCTMYLPYIEKRFGKAVKPSPYLGTRALYTKNGGIILVKKEKKNLAGILFQMKGKTLYAINYGINIREQNLATRLAGHAALYFLIEWAKKNGITGLDYGLTMPFITDGTFQYKKEWGMFLEPRTDESVWVLKLNNVNDGTLSFLQHNPFILSCEKRVKGVFFINHKPTEAELQRISSNYFIPRLHSLIVIAYYHPDLGFTKENGVILNTKYSFPDVKPLHNICLRLQREGYEVDVFENAVRTSNSSG